MVTYKCKIIIQNHNGFFQEEAFLSRHLFFLMSYVLSQRFTCRVDGFVVGRDVPHISVPNIRRKRELSFP